MQVVVLGQEVQLCGQCEGVWLRKASLRDFARVPREQMENSPLAATLVDDHPDAQVDPRLKCPVCFGDMVRFNYAGDSGVIADNCKDHGIWLDDGELGVILDFLKKVEEYI